MQSRHRTFPQVDRRSYAGSATPLAVTRG